MSLKTSSPDKSLSLPIAACNRADTGPAELGAVDVGAKVVVCFVGVFDTGASMVKIWPSVVEEVGSLESSRLLMEGAKLNGAFDGSSGEAFEEGVSVSLPEIDGDTILFVSSIDDGARLGIALNMTGEDVGTSPPGSGTAAALILPEELRDDLVPRTPPTIAATAQTTRQTAAAMILDLAVDASASFPLAMASVLVFVDGAVGPGGGGAGTVLSSGLDSLVTSVAGSAAAGVCAGAASSGGRSSGDLLLASSSDFERSVPASNSGSMAWAVSASSSCSISSCGDAAEVSLLSDFSVIVVPSL